jgi:hypothetical protein
MIAFDPKRLFELFSRSHHEQFLPHCAGLKFYLEARDRRAGTIDKHAAA